MNPYTHGEIMTRKEEVEEVFKADVTAEGEMEDFYRNIVSGRFCDESSCINYDNGNCIGKKVIYCEGKCISYKKEKLEAPLAALTVQRMDLYRRLDAMIAHDTKLRLLKPIDILGILELLKLQFFIGNEGKLKR